jgi:rhodanese-related sulfurtransferase
VIPQITPPELATWRDDATREPPLLVDVREPWETAICSIEGSRNVPMAQLPAALPTLPQDRDIVLVCHHGNRSMHVALWLRNAGFDRVHNLHGGVEAWARTVEPAMARY